MDDEEFRLRVAVLLSEVAFDILSSDGVKSSTLPSDMDDCGWDFMASMLLWHGLAPTKGLVLLLKQSVGRSFVGVLKRKGQKDGRHWEYLGNVGPNRCDFATLCFDVLIRSFRLLMKVPDQLSIKAYKSL